MVSAILPDDELDDEVDAEGVGDDAGQRPEDPLRGVRLADHLEAVHVRLVEEVDGRLGARVLVAGMRRLLVQRQVVRHPLLRRGRERLQAGIDRLIGLNSYSVTRL